MPTVDDLERFAEGNRDLARALRNARTCADGSVENRRLIHWLDRSEGDRLAPLRALQAAFATGDRVLVGIVTDAVLSDAYVPDCGMSVGDIAATQRRQWGRVWMRLDGRDDHGLSARIARSDEHAHDRMAYITAHADYVDGLAPRPRGAYGRTVERGALQGQRYLVLSKWLTGVVRTVGPLLSGPDSLQWVVEWGWCGHEGTGEIVVRRWLVPLKVGTSARDAKRLLRTVVSAAELEVRAGLKAASSLPGAEPHRTHVKDQAKAVAVYLLRHGSNRNTLRQSDWRRIACEYFAADEVRTRRIFTELEEQPETGEMRQAYRNAEHALATWRIMDRGV